LLLWIAAAAALLWFAPRPPGPPDPTEEELAATQRGTALVLRNVTEWQEEYGDRGLPWDEAEGHLAIVIDDVGRELHVFEKLTSVRYRLTFGVLPGADYSAGVQLRLNDDRRRYREILLHMPMEPLERARMFDVVESSEVFLLRSDSPEQLRAKLEDALQRVPTAVGINNHMGSALSADPDAMNAIMPVLAERKLFLLDSRTTASTAAEDAAREHQVPVLVRHVFLDNEVTEEAIARQLDRAAEMSLEHPVVAIGHPSVELHAVLERDLDTLYERKIVVYPLSWLLTSRGSGRGASR
jgi:polysaccharide deacetylase 2 family uncharacterized protein YibQ